MIRTTPFRPRLAELDDQHLFTHWEGHLSPLRYTHAPKHEYFAVRHAVGLFDTSPLHQYRVTGPGAERLLAGVLLRDVRRCDVGRAQYTAWCDERGFVRHDGLVLREADGYLLSAARATHGWLADLARDLPVSLPVEVQDVSDDLAVLAVQGPAAPTVLAPLVGAVSTMRAFDHLRAPVAGHDVLVSATGFTGGPGFELTVAADGALDVLDAVLAAGRGHGVRPYGEEAMDVLRVEAGLPLVDVEWHDGRLAETDADRVTPDELGLGWMVDPGRAFVGADAVRRERRDGSTRWRTVGVVVDWEHWDALHRASGRHPAVLEARAPYELLLTQDDGTEVGYTTSLVWSPLLQAHVGLARVRPDLAAPGTVLHQELVLDHHATRVRVRTTTPNHLRGAR
ncbi:aminomethyltransferase family protein [Nocardioides marmoraquaticus]